MKNHRLKIVAVNYAHYSDDVLNIQFDSDDTFLDADILIIDPEELDGLWQKFASRGSRDGVLYLYSSKGSDNLRALFQHRRQEITNLLNNGKLVFSFLSPYKSVAAEIDDTSQYEFLSNYDWLPDNILAMSHLIRRGTGNHIVLQTPNHPIAPFYKGMKESLFYKAYFDFAPKEEDGFLVNKAKKPVGLSMNVGKGLLVFMPYLSSTSTEKLPGILIQCAQPILLRKVKSPEPEWAKNYAIPGEKTIIENIKTINQKIYQLDEQKNQIEINLEDLAGFRGLLYEQGTTLQKAVLKALTLMGFKADTFETGDMEHDVQMSSAEGVAVGEVEGKDRNAIHIEKFDQLSRVYDEYFNMHDQFPNAAILFGNPFRTIAPENRKESFTTKVTIAAERKQFCLVTTVELYRAVVKILENPENEDLKKACRQAFFATKGKEPLKFPID